VSEKLTVGDFTAKPGTKVTGVQEIEIAGQQLEIPLFLIAGTEEGPTFVVTAGVHGAEYASIAAALEIGQSVEPEGLRGRLIVAPVVNMPAFRARSIYVCPLDDTNLNRVFPGNADGAPSEQLAAWLFQNIMTRGDYYMDMHGGDMIEALVPFAIYHRTGNEEVDKKSLELAKMIGIHYVVRSESMGSAYSAVARTGIPAVLTEAGGQGIWPPEAVALHANGVRRLLRHLGMVEGPEPEPIATEVLDQFLWLRSEHTGYSYPKVAVGDMVREGQELGVVTDFLGTVLQSANAPADGRVLFLVSSLAINKGDPLLAVGA
jgi:predicted deacylase